VPSIEKQGTRTTYRHYIDGIAILIITLFRKVLRCTSVKPYPQFSSSFVLAMSQIAIADVESLKSDLLACIDNRKRFVNGTFFVNDLSQTAC